MLNLTQLQAFVETCRCGSYTQAAQNLSISQPALHHKVKQLEVELGAPLLMFRDRRVIPTIQGHTLLDVANRILEDAAGIERMFGPPATSTTLRVAAVSWFAQSLNVAVETFQKAHPSVSILVDIIESDEVLGALQSQHVELVVTSGDRLPDGVVTEPLHPIRVVCAAPVSHPLVDGRIHPLKDLLDYPLALTRKGMVLRGRIEQLFRDHAGATELPVYWEARTGTILGMIVSSSERSITFAPELFLSTFRLAEIQLDVPAMLTTQVICHLPRRSMRPIAREFIAMLSGTSGATVLNCESSE